MDAGAPGTAEEKQLRVVLDAMPHCLIYLTPEGVVLHVNRVGGNLLEWPPSELAGRHISAILPDNDAEDFFAGAAESEPAIPPLPRRQVFCTHSGRHVHVETTLTPFREESGAVRFLCWAREAADPADDQRRQEAHAELFRALMEYAVDPIFVKDAHGRYTMVNRAFLEMAAQNEDEIVGRTDLDLLPEEQARRIMAADRQVLETGQTVRADEELSVAGKELRLDYTKTPVYGPNGGIVGLVGIARDVTSERALAAQLIQSQKMELISSLAGRISHEFNNLLTSLLGNLSLAETRLQRGEDVATPLRASRALAETATELTRRLLHLSKNQHAEFVALKPAEAIRDALAAVRPLLGKRIDVRMRLDPQCWSIAADPQQLQQALAQLCLNARDSLEERHGAADAAADGPPWIEIVAENVVVKPNIPAMESRHAKPGEYVRVTVADNGAGIAPDALPHVFEPFYETRANPRESGLALAMVYATVSRHGGWTAVESEPNLGSDFIIYLPRAAEAEQTAAAGLLPFLRDDLRRRKILIIDDDVEVRFLLERVLSEHGFGVFVADGGAAGWEILRRECRSLDLIVLDLIMPEMSGAHFVELMRQECLDVPVLICSGHPGELAMEQVRRWGVTDFIGKPFTPTAFLEKVHEALAAHAGRNPV